MVGILLYIPYFIQLDSLDSGYSGNQQIEIRKNGSDFKEYEGLYFITGGDLNNTNIKVDQKGGHLRIHLPKSRKCYLEFSGFGEIWYPISEKPVYCDSVLFCRDSEGDIIEMNWIQNGNELNAVRLDPVVRKNDIRSVMHQPEIIGDGWMTASCQNEGIEPKNLAMILKRIRAGTYKGIDGFVIVKNGKLVAEQYFDGFNRDSMHLTRSSFKSVVSILVGIAIEDGIIRLKDKIVDYLPEYDDCENWDERKKDITIEHLLNMRAGYDCEEIFGLGPVHELKMVMSHDWLKYCIDLPLIHNPGEQWSYCSNNVFLLSVILANATGMSILEFAEQRLFVPLEISTYSIEDGCLSMKPRDLAKIGQLILNDGNWKDTKIVSSKWIRESTRMHTIIPWSWTTEWASSKKNSNTSGYGYLWFQQDFYIGKRKYRGVFAWGNGGQYIMVFPSLNLVVVFTGSNYSQTIQRAQLQPFDILVRYILPGVKDHRQITFDQNRSVEKIMKNNEIMTDREDRFRFGKLVEEYQSKRFSKEIEQPR